MADLDVLASWVQDRWAEEETRALGKAETYTDQWHTMLCGERQLYWTQDCNCGVPAAVLADLESKRALLADLMADGHEHWCDYDGEDGYLACICGRDERVLRRLRILARPYAGRDMPAELREA